MTKRTVFERTTREVTLLKRGDDTEYREFVEHKCLNGGSLLDRMTTKDTIREAQVVFFMRQLLQALEQMHDKNIVHLDLKPENIMLCEPSRDQIKLVDFGLSRKLSPDKDTFGTLGAPEFVSPEIVEQRPVSLASDMWSVGVLAYVLLSGVSPFLGDNDKETLSNVVTGKWTFAPQQFELVSADGKDFIKKLLVIDPRRRLSVHSALTHPWLHSGEADSSDQGAELSTIDLKEFKYRHQWVERRIFVQTSPDDEKVHLKSPKNTLEWMEPLYFPPPLSEIPRSPRAAAAESFLDEDDDAATGGPAAGSASKRPKDVEDSDGIRARLVPKPELDEDIANRILSDISEENSSEEDATVSRFTDGDRTLTMDEQADLSTAASLKSKNGRQSALLRPKVLTDLNVDTAAAAGNGMSARSPLSPRSPVIMSPTPPKEVDMTAVIATNGQKRTNSGDRRRRAGATNGASTAINGEPEDAVALAAAATKNGSGNDESEFDLLMAEVDRMKTTFKQRLGELQNLDERVEKSFQQAEEAAEEEQARRTGKAGPPASDRNRRDGTKQPAMSNGAADHTLDLDEYDWESAYQTGPETYLLQVRDPGLASRIRDYRRSLYGDDTTYHELGLYHRSSKYVTVRERRRYTDMVKTDKDLQQTESFALTHSTSVGAIGGGMLVKRARSACTTNGFAAAGVYSDYQGAKTPQGEHAPIFQYRLKDAAFEDGKSASMSCTVVGQPIPEVTWYRNDALVTDNQRYKMTYSSGKAVLTISPAFITDAGLFKCLAQNVHGETCGCARLRAGDRPDRPSRPEIELASDTELFITWQQPASTGGQELLGYKLEHRRAGEGEWTCPWMIISSAVEEDAVILRHLEPNGVYQFRVSARNAFGWGEPSLSSRIVQTHQRGAPKLNMDTLRKEYHFNTVNMPHGSSSLGAIREDAEADDEASPGPDRSEEGRDEQNANAQLQRGKPVELNTTEDPASRYQLDAEIFRGRLCLIRNAVDKKREYSSHCVAKVLLASRDYKAQALQEYQLLREAQHENVVVLINAYLREDFLLLFMERLEEDLLARFTKRDYYTEENVAHVVSQIVAALQWMHYKRIVHMNVQSDNIMFTTKRSWTVKLLDLGQAVLLDDSGEAKVDASTMPAEYLAPEVLQSGTVTPAADMWGVGVLVFILVSGFHPFCSDEDVKSPEHLARDICTQKIDLNYVHSNTSQEALQFMTWALKKHPLNRISTEEALVHRWLHLNDAMVRRRENIRYSANRLRVFQRQFGWQKMSGRTTNNQLLTVYGTGSTNGSV